MITMKKVSLIVITIIVVVGGISWCLYRHPKHLASSANYIADFFELPSNTVNTMTVLDELHSQGKTTVSFGINHYWLKFENVDAAVEAIRDAGGSERDSVWTLTKVRGHYIGTFSVSLKEKTGHLRYAEIDD